MAGGIVYAQAEPPPFAPASSYAIRTCKEKSKAYRFIKGFCQLKEFSPVAISLRFIAGRPGLPHFVSL